MGNEKSSRFRHMLARAAGWSWGAIWLWAISCILGVWNDLGGIVGERLLWLACFVPSVAVITGCLVGKWSRLAAQGDPRRTHVLLLRWILWPQAAVVAVGLVVLHVTGHDDVVGVVVAGFLGYWAGLDLGFGIWPLICGRHYSPWSAIEPDPPDDEDRDDALEGRFPI